MTDKQRILDAFDDLMRHRRSGEPHNSPDCLETVVIGDELFNIAHVDHPGGGNSFEVLDAVRFRADPDAAAGEHFGLTWDQYREWVVLEGTPLCSQRTKAGKLWATRSDPASSTPANGKHFIGSARAGRMADHLRRARHGQ